MLSIYDFVMRIAPTEDTRVLGLEQQCISPENNDEL